MTAQYFHEEEECGFVWNADDAATASTEADIQAVADLTEPALCKG